MKSIPALSWLNAKTQPSSNPRKNNSGYATEHNEALKMDEIFVPTPKASPEEPLMDFPHSQDGQQWNPVTEVDDAQIEAQV